MAQVSLSHISKTYPNGFVAVQPASFDIPDGEFVVLVGPSGCGKSSMLRMIAGLEDISGGDLHIGDRLVNDLDPRRPRYRDGVSKLRTLSAYDGAQEYRLRPQEPQNWQGEIDRKVTEASRF